MIKIRKDSNEFVVTKGVYEDKFKDLGYEIVGDNKPAAKSVKDVEFKETVKEVAEKPVASETEEKPNKDSKFSNRK